MNPTRLAFIRGQHHLFSLAIENVLGRGQGYQFPRKDDSISHLQLMLPGTLYKKDPYCAKPFEGLKFVDVGCGGGFLSEPLARMGATVIRIDAVEKNIKIARLHALLHQSSIFAQQLVHAILVFEEKLVEEQRKFDAVLALEVIKHVADPSEFCKSLSALTVSNGATMISTINLSMRAHTTSTVVAEYLLHWLPKGTHQWSSFLTPEQLVLVLQRASISVLETAGLVYDPLTG